MDECNIGVRSFFFFDTPDGVRNPTQEAKHTTRQKESTAHTEEAKHLEPRGSPRNERGTKLDLASFLPDVGRKIASKFGVVLYLSDLSSLMHPSSLV